MQSIRGMRGICAGAALMLSASWASAAILDVPGSYATVQEAIDAASAGDTVMITDSGTYQGSWQIDKPLNIEAWPGRSPLVTNIEPYLITGDTFGAGPTQVALIDIHDGGSGTRIGSLDGGTIRFIHDQSDDTNDNTNFPYFLNMYENVEEVTVENVFVSQILGDGDRFRLIRDDFEVARTLNITRLEYDDNNSGEPSESLRIRNPNLTVNLSESRFYGYDDGGAVAIYGFANTWNISNCLIDGRGAGRAILNWGADMTIDGSIILGDTGNGAFDHRLSGSGDPEDVGSLTMTNSVVGSEGERAISAGSTNAFTWSIDHCDIIIAELDGDFGAVRANGGTTRSISITNSNIIGLSDGGNTATVLVNIDNDPSDVLFELDHNNYFADAGWADLLTTYAQAVDNNSQNLDPNYESASPGEGDVRYSDVTLKTADSTGGPIGNDNSLIETVPVELSTFEVL